MGCGLCPEETQCSFGGHRTGLRQGRLHQVCARSQVAQVALFVAARVSAEAFFTPLPLPGSRTVVSILLLSLHGVFIPTRIIWMGSSLPS